MTTRYIGLILLAALLAAGCDKKQVKPEEMPDVGKVFSQADACMMAGDTNGALSLLTQAMDDKAYAKGRGYLYGYVLNILLMADRVDEAKAKYQAVLGKDEELTRAGFGMLYSYYQRKGDTDALEAWVKQMVEVPLPKDLLAQSYAWYMGILRGKGQFDKVLELVPVCMKKFDPGMSQHDR